MVVVAIQGYEHPLAFVFLFFIQAHLGFHYLPRNDFDIFVLG